MCMNIHEKRVTLSYMGTLLQHSAQSFIYKILRLISMARNTNAAVFVSHCVTSNISFKHKGPACQNRQHPVGGNQTMKTTSHYTGYMRKRSGIRRQYHHKIREAKFQRDGIGPARLNNKRENPTSKFCQGWSMGPIENTFNIGFCQALVFVQNICS